MKFPARIIVVIGVLAFACSFQGARAQFNFASDNAGNSVYSPSWDNNDNGGTGFGGWGFSTGANSGVFIGDPNNNGVSTSAMGATAFGMFATGSGYMNASRGFSTGLQVGDIFMFDWGINWDANGGSKGFDLKAGSTTLVTILNSGGANVPNISAGSMGSVSTAYGTGNMAVSITRTTSGYSFSMTRRNDGSTFSGTFGGANDVLDNINFFIGNQNDGSGNRNMFFDNLSITNTGVFNQGGSITYSRALSGSGALRVTNNTTLILAIDGSTGFTGASTVASGSTLQIGNGGGVGDLAGNITNNGTVTFNRNANTLTYGGVISGSGGVTKNGAGGQITLSGVNTYSGKTIINGGTISIAADSGLGTAPGSVVVDQLQLNGGTLAVSSGFTLNSNRGITLNTGGGTIDVASGQTLTYGGVMAGANAFTKAGAGILTLGGSNSFSGQLVISAGTLSITNANSLGTGQFNLGNASTLTTLLVNSNTTITNTFQVYNAAANAVVNVAANATNTISGKLTQDGAKANTTKFGKDGAGTLILNNSTSDYNGQIQIGQGTVIFGANNAVGTNASTGQRGIDIGLNISDASQANNVTLLASNGVTVGQSIYVAPNTTSATRTIGITGGGTNTFNNEFYMDGTLTVDAGANATDRVNMSGNIINTGGLIKTNAGILVLSGSGNTYSGGTTLNQGTLRLGTNNILGTGGFTINGGTLASDSSTARTNTNAITMGGDVTLGETSTGTGTLTLSNVSLGGATRTFTVNANSTIAGVISNGASTAGLTKQGTGTLTLSGANTYSGATTISGGTLSVSASNNLGAAPGSATTNQVTINGGTLAVTTGFTANTNAGITIGASGGTIDVASGQTLTQVAGLSGSGNLSKTNAGTLVLTNGTGAYSGTITINGGTLRVNANHTSAKVTVANGGTLMGSATIGDVAINSGGTISPGNSPGTLTVGAVTFGGGGNYNWQLHNVDGAAGTGYDTMTGSGALTIGANSGNQFNINLWTLSSISPSDVNGSAINFNSASNYDWVLGTFSSISGFDATAFKINTLANNGANGFANPYSGSFAVTNNSTQLLLTYRAPLASYSVSVSSGATNNQGSATGGTNQFTGAGATLTLSGGGTLVMTNSANDYTGKTTVVDGTLQINVNAGASSGALGNTSGVDIGTSTNAAAAGFNIGVASVTNSKDITIVAGNGAGGTRMIGTTITSGQAVQAGNVALGTNTVFNAATNATMLYSGVISGAGAVTVSNSGTSIFSGNNTYTNTTTILTNATLRIANSSALGTTNGNTVVNDGGTLAFSNNISTAEAISIAGNGVGSGGALRSISGVNTNTGTVTLTADATIAADSGSSLQLGNIDIGSTNRSLYFDGAGTTIVTGNFSNMSTATTFYKNGTGELIISNTSANTGGGQLQVGNGKVTLAAGTFSTNSASSPRGLDLGLTAISGSSTSDTAFYVNSGVTMSNTVYVAPAGTGGLGIRTLGTESTSGTATFSGEIYLGGDLTVAAASGGTALFSGNITNTGNLIKTNAGTVILSAANTFSGNVDVRGGTLVFSNASSTAIADTTAVSISNGATLSLGTGETVGSIAGAGNITLNTNQLIAGQNNTNSTFSGVMSSSSTGASFVKKGTGTLTLSGANTMSGQVYLVGGTTLFSVNQGATFTNTIHVGETSGSDTATLALNNGITLVNPVTVRSGSGGAKTIQSLSTSGTNTLSGAITFNDNTTLDSTNGGTLVLSGVISGSGTATKTGLGTVILSGSSANTFTNTTTVNAGVLVLQKTGVNALAGTPTINNGGTIRLGANDQFAGDSTFMTINSGGTFDLNGYSETLAFQGAGSITLGSGALTINPGFTDTFSGVISGSGRVIKANNGTQILSGSNTYTGGTLVSGGVLRIGGGGTTGSVAGDITNNATVTFDRSDAITYGGTMSGTGSLQKWGTGTLTLSGSNTVSGANHYFLNGTVLFSANQGIGGTINLGDTQGTDSATLALGGTGVTLTNAILVRGGSSNNTLTIAAQNTSGTSVLSGGITMGQNLTIAANSGGNLLITNSALVMTNNGSNFDLTITGSNNVTIASAITAPSGASDLNVSGTGTVTLSGNNSANYLKMILNSGTLSVSSLNNLGNTAGGYYQDKINFNGGTLLVTEDLTIAANTFGMTSSGSGGTINVASGKTFTQNAYFSSGNAAGSFNKTGAGTLVLGDAANNINPIFNIREGTVSVSTTSALGQTATGGNTITLGDTSTAGTFLFTGAGTNATTSRTITVNAGGGTININDGTSSLTVANGMNFNGGFTKAGSGTLALQGTATGSGATTVGGGVLQVTNASSLGSGTLVVSNGAALEITNSSGMTLNRSLTLNGTGPVSGALRSVGGANTNSGAITLAGNSTIGVTAGSLVVSGNVANAGNTLTLDTYGVGGTPLTVSGAVSGTGGLTKIGGGTAVLSGANAYAGTTTINVGVLEVSSSGNLGASTNSVAIADGATLRSTASLTNSRAITISSGTGYVEASGGTTNTMSGTLTKDGTKLVLGGGGAHVVNGSIVGTSANSDLIISNSTTTINSTNSYNGPTLVVSGGTLNNGINNALPTNTALTLGQSGETSGTTNTYNVSGYSQTVDSVATAGNGVNVVTNTTGTGNLTLNSSTAKSISGLTMGGANLTLTKAGANTVTLASGNNISASTIAIQQGTLLLGASNQIGNSTEINLAGGTFALGGNTDTVGKLTVSSDSIFDFGTSGGGATTFTFSDFNTAAYNGVAVMTINNAAVGSAIVFNQNYSGNASFNTFASKVQFGGSGQFGQISFGTGTTQLLVAIPDARVYSAAAFLLVLIGVTEMKRRRGKKRVEA